MKRLFLSLMLVVAASAIFAQEKQRPAENATPPEAPKGAKMMSFKNGQAGQLNLLTSETLDSKIKAEWASSSRSILSSGWDAIGLAAKGKLTSASVALVQEGIGQVYKLLKRNATRRKTWLDAVQKQNQWTDSITTATEAKDFYKNISRVGALDPQGMQFDGFSFRQNMNGELAYNIHCVVDVSEQGLKEITQHGKFLLRVDTLYINPYLCHLPTVRPDYEFEFEEGAESVNYKVNFSLTSSWMNEAIEYFRNQKIGEFLISLTLTKDMLNKTDQQGRGVYEYIASRDADMMIKPSISGESLIVPRSYLGRFDDDEEGKVDVWSTGQFNIKLNISETRRIDSGKYWADSNKKPKFWKSDFKKRTHHAGTGFKKWVVQEVGSNGQTLVTTLVTSAATPMINELIYGSASGAAGAKASTGATSAKSAAGGSAAKPSAGGGQPSGGQPSGGQPSGGQPFGGGKP